MWAQGLSIWPLGPGSSLAGEPGSLVRDTKHPLSRPSRVPGECSERSCGTDKFTQSAHDGRSLTHSAKGRFTAC
jgi:hypothetical protein